MLKVRPYQLLCVVCGFGEYGSGPRDPQLRTLLEKIRANPDLPVSLRCNVDDLFSYQSPGIPRGAAGGAEYNRKRDLDILRILDLPPGIVLPARIILLALLKRISTVRGLCAYGSVAPAAWQGCPKAFSGYYERGRRMGIQAIVPPRKPAERACDRALALKEMRSASAIRARPHILLCAVAQYGNGIRPPFADDNLPEMIQRVLRKPSTHITLVSGADRMMCGPCPYRNPIGGVCAVGAFGSGGLYNELKDLNVLQRLGLAYGATLEARELFGMIFRRIPDVRGVCALDRGIPRSSLWRDACGRDPDPCPGYRKGRRILMKALAGSDRAKASVPRHFERIRGS